MDAGCSLYHAFGVHASCGAATYLDESNIMYPVGRNLVINDPMDLKDKEGGAMSFMALEMSISSMALAPDRRHVAVVENDGGGVGVPRSGLGASGVRVSLYKLETCARVKTLNLSEMHDVCFDEIVSIAFSSDSKMLALQCGAPGAWTLVHWHLHSNKPLVHLKLDEAVSRISVHPDDAHTIFTTGQAAPPLRTPPGRVAARMRQPHPCATAPGCSRAARLTAPCRLCRQA